MTGVIAVLATADTRSGQLFEASSKLADDLESLLGGVADPSRLPEGEIDSVLKRVPNTIGVIHDTVKDFGGVGPKKMSRYYNVARMFIINA